MNLQNIDDLIKILKFENARSYYLNALTNRRNSKKIDLSLFEELYPLVVSKALKELLIKGKSSITVNFKDFDDQEERAKAFFLKNFLRTQARHRITELRDHGIDSLRIGYPMISRIDKGVNGKSIYSPLFTWKADLLSNEQTGDYTLMIGVDQDWSINNTLLAFQSSRDDDEPKFEACLQTIKDIPGLDENAFKDFIRSVQNLIPDFERGNSDDLLSNELVGLIKIPQTKSDLVKINEDLPVEYKFHNSAVLGLFKSTKEPIIKDLEHYKESLSKADFTSNGIALNPNSPFDLDPSQRSSYNVLESEKNLVIHGPPGTGKSTVLSGIITSALKENKKILFVCEKLTALEVIKDKLKENNLDLEVAMIRDIVSDKKQILQQAKNLINEEHQRKAFVESTLVADFERNIKKHDKHIKALEHDFLFGWSYKKCCGRRINLKNKSVVPPAFSKPFLSRVQDSGESILSSIKEVEYEYFQIRERKAYTSILSLKSDANFFALSEGLTELTKSANQMYQEFFTLKNGAIEKSIQLINERIDTIKESIKELDYLTTSLKNKEEKISLYFEPQSLKKTVKTKFNKEYDRVKSSIEDIKKLNDSKGDTNIEFNKEFHFNVLDHFKSELKLWKLKKSEIEVDNVDIKLLEQYRNEDFKKLEALQRSWLELLKEPIFKKEVKKLEENSIEVVNSLETMESDLGSINAFMELVGLINDLELTEFEEDFAKLFDLRDWNEYLELALLNNVLESKNIQSYSDLHTSSRVIEKIKERYEEIIDNEPRSLKHKIQSFRNDFLSEFLLNNNLELNQLFSSTKSNRNNLLQLFSNYQDLLTAIFPLILTTPQAASTLFRGAHKYFDLVLFDEASQLTIEDAFASLLKGKKIIISGDEHQMPPSKFFIGEIDDEENEGESDEEYWERQKLLDESLLKFGINNQSYFKSSYLDFHYRSQHHRLIDFSNAAFYKRLIPIPQEHEYNPIDFFQINGYFENGSNQQEAEKTIEVLQGLSYEFVEKNSVGVATLNVEQQKLIWTLIDQKQEDDILFRQRMQQLEDNGFFVKNLDSLQGDERDMIILNVCYGRKREGNKFSRTFGMLNRSTGHRLLNVLVTRARRRMIILNSIPTSEFQSYHDHLMTKGNRGSAVFYAYLNYAKAVSENDQEQIASTLSALRGDKIIKNRIYDELESPFEEEVYEMLRGTYSDNEISIAEEDSGFRIDMVLRPATKSGLKIAIECDGAAYHSGYKNHYADLHRQKILEGSGYIFIRIWSKSWFLSPENEFEKLERNLSEIIHNYRPNQKTPAYTQSIEVDLGEEAVIDSSIEGLVVEEDDSQKDHFDDTFSDTEEVVLASPDTIKLKLGTKVTLKELKNHLRQVDITISEKANVQKNTVSIDSALANVIRKRTIGEEFDFGKNRFKLLSVN
ncbi:AAA domain-containing protein [Roseivirga pacifica]|uniref:AAA domain-containing protein n=1 Tax=Roseivirga pacifica TaxID=1267423 RepID=UPI003BAB88C7